MSVEGRGSLNKYLQYSYYERIFQLVCLEMLIAFTHTETLQWRHLRPHPHELKQSGWGDQQLSHDTRDSCSGCLCGYDWGFWKSPEESASCLSFWAVRCTASRAHPKPGFAAKITLDQIPTLQVLIQAQPRTDSRASPGELRNTHLEDTRSLRWERSREEGCRAIGEPADGNLVDWGLRCTWDLHFPGRVGVTWSLIMPNPGR